MEIKVNEFYRSNEQDEIGRFYSVRAVDEDMVTLVCRTGGWLEKMPVKEFATRYEHVTAEEFAALADKYQEKHFDFDEWDHTIPAWSNGDRWNGWGCPHFERETIQQAIDEGLIDSPYSKIVMLEDAVMVIQALGDALPADYDWSAIEAMLRADEEVYDHEIAPGVSIEGELYPKVTITVDGREIETYPLGAGSWCWNQYDEPRVQSAPTP